MQIILKLLCLVLILSTFIYGQQHSRRQKIEEWRKVTIQLKRSGYASDKLQERWQKLMEEIVSVSNTDETEAKKNGAKAYRLFPDKMVDQMLDNPDSYGASAYAFTEISNYYYALLLHFKNNSLVVQNNYTVKSTHGFIADIGKISLENLNEQSPKFIALAKYQPPETEKNIKNLFSADGIDFGKMATIRVGHSYLVRGIDYQGGDGIFALQIHRQDTDGSIIVFIKTIKTFAPPKLIPPPIAAKAVKHVIPDEKLVKKITTALRLKGFNNVQIGIEEHFLTLTGTVPKRKMAEALKIVIENARIPVKNMITER